jgi:hypothetical protein
MWSAEHNAVTNKKRPPLLKKLKTVFKFFNWLFDNTASIRYSVDNGIINEYGAVDGMKNSLAFA